MGTSAVLSAEPVAVPRLLRTHCFGNEVVQHFILTEVALREARRERFGAVAPGVGVVVGEVLVRRFLVSEGAVRVRMGVPVPRVLRGVVAPP